MADPLYGEDLADIQARAYGGHVADARPGLLTEMRRARIHSGRVVDLGCGGGEWLAHLGDAGYEAVGVEPSPTLCEHARRRAPAAHVVRGTAEEADLSGAVAVTALGEVFNYLPPEGRAVPLPALFRRIARALPRGGLLMFDLIVAGSPSLAGRSWRADEDWLIAVDMREDLRRGRGERRITVFRRSEETHWRRSDEVHRIRIPERARVLGALRGAGFAVRTRRRWHEAPLLPRRVAFVARRR